MDIGHLITIGIVILIIVLFRLIDKSRNSLGKVGKYIDKSKSEIDDYFKRKSLEIKNFSINLDVEKKSADLLMQKIQNITREELNNKVNALAAIDERIRDYDSSLEELVEMTGRVQENLNLIQEESAYVEGVGKHLNEFSEKAEYIEGRIDNFEKKLVSIEQSFVSENTKTLEKAVDSIMNETRSTIMDFEESAQTIERKLEEHRDAIEHFERGREERMERDGAKIEKLLTEALNRAGSRADKTEEAALLKLKEQAQERIAHMKLHFEEKIKTVQETVKSKAGDIQDHLKSSREEWKAESAAIEAAHKSFNAVLKKDINEIRQQSEDISSMIQKQNEEFNGIISKQKEAWEKLTRSTGVDIITAVEDRLESYRAGQEEQFNQLAGIADDNLKMKAEFELSIQKAIDKVNQDFVKYNKEIEENWDKASGEFSNHLKSVKNELAGIDQEIAEIKEKSFQNVSKKLKGFEDEFLTDLSKRSAEIDIQLAEWQENTNKRIEELSESAVSKRQKAEAKMLEEMKKNLAVQGEKLIADLDRLKTETVAFEEGIREEMNAADDSKKSFREQLERDLDEAKSMSENELNKKISEFGLFVTDTLRQNQRDLDTQIRELASDLKEQISNLKTTSENFRSSADEWQSQYSVRMRELDEALEETRRRTRELTAENDERFVSTKASLEEIRKELAVQSKLFNRTDSLKAELSNYVEDMSSNIERISQLKNDITRFENQFTQIKRLEDDVNAKMTRFLSEKHRIEVMENDFNRMLTISQSVEEKLSQVSNSDDILQNMQIQLRHLEDIIKETEEKYQRVERKSKTIQETNDGIDRNFRALQEDEQSIERLKEIITVLKNDMKEIQSSVETLSAENERAMEAAEKVSTLDESIKHLEKRIAEMNVAREGLARLATEMQNLEKDAKSQVKMIRTMLDREEGNTLARAGKAAEKNPLSVDIRENIIKLKRQGWSVDEIARALKISKGEAQLYIDIGLKD